MDEREIVTVPEGCNRIGHKAEQQNDSGVNGCGKETAALSPHRHYPELKATRSRAPRLPIAEDHLRERTTGKARETTTRP